MGDTNMDTAQKLDDRAIEALLAELPDWVRSGDVLQRTFACGDFVKAMSFVNALAKAAEAARHHPDILVRYSKVTLTLSTHEAGGITDKDFGLAAIIDSFYGV